MRKGLLLMEALVALLVLVSMSTIIGSYWHYLYSMRSEAQHCLERLSVARAAVQNFLMNQESISNSPYDISYEYSPLTVRAESSLALPPLSLVTITVAGTDKKASRVKTLYGER